jgi:predicted PurR-regulated permease PerM
MPETPDPSLPREPALSRTGDVAPAGAGDAAPGDDRSPPGLPVHESHFGPLHVLAVLATLFTCWAARDLLVPIMLAMFFALIGNPVVRRLRKLWVPRWIGALAVVFGGLAASIFLASLLVGPAGDWVRQVPTELKQVTPKLRLLTKQVDQANKAAESIAKAAGAAPTLTNLPTDKPRAPNLWTAIGKAPEMLASLGAVVLLTYFFLVYGAGLQRQAISLLPDRHQKGLTVDILRRIETDVSRYVLTITVINIGLGLILTGALYWLGLDIADALLWGTVAALLNYAPYVGPLTGVIVLGIVGVVAFDDPGRMLLPPAIYLGLHALESQAVTPVILGRRMAISPLVMLLWLMLWGWLWGIAGLLLAVPMLACFKILSERVEGWQGWAKVIE